VAVLSVGCQNEGLSSIDRRVNQLIADRSGLLGNDAVPPEYRGVNQSNETSDKSTTAKTPASVNPDLDKLEFKPRPTDAKDEAAAVEERLSAFQDLPSVENGARLMTLADALKQAQRTAREYITLEEDYVLAAIRLLQERHLWGPRLFNDTTTEFNSVQIDGDTSTTLNVINTLRATQRLPYGGEVEAAWVTRAVENLRSAATEQYTQSSDIVLSGNIPLLRNAGLIAQENLIQSERDVVYAARTFEDRRRAFFVDISRDFFELQRQQKTIGNTLLQITSVQVQLEQQEALFRAGRQPQFEVNRAEFELLRAKRNLADQREAYVLTLDRFKLRLGIPVTERLAIAERDDQADIPMPDISLEEATALALEYRLDLQNRRDQLDDRRRAVANARNQLLPDLNLRGSVGVGTDADEREGGLVFEPDDSRYLAALTLGLPLDREIERLNLRASQIGLEQAVREFDRFRDDLIINVRGQVRNIDRSKFALLLAEREVQITESRAREQDLKRDEVTPRDRLDTQTDLRNARNARDLAATELRNSILDYLLATGQMRVDRDGVFRRLPGMPTVSGAPTGQP
jgi:outer membrane protein TolC